MERKRDFRLKVMRILTLYVPFGLFCLVGMVGAKVIVFIKLFCANNMRTTLFGIPPRQEIAVLCILYAEAAGISPIKAVFRATLAEKTIFCAFYTPRRQRPPQKQRRKRRQGARKGVKTILKYLLRWEKIGFGGIFFFFWKYSRIIAN